MLTALAIIVSEGKVLIGKVKTELLPEYGGLEYVFPCTQPKNEENTTDALMREVALQCGIRVSIAEKIGERVHPVTNNLTEYYRCERSEDEAVKASPESDMEQYIWVEVQDIAKYMPSLFEQIVEHLEIN
ncbi:hypothetical protein KBD34_01790 [Patescibacteria group bacterium]|nr:hypothetical protein [Patescibacteria group bacterium]